MSSGCTCSAADDCSRMLSLAGSNAPRLNVDLICSGRNAIISLAFGLMIPS